MPAPTHGTIRTKSTNTHAARTARAPSKAAKAEKPAKARHMTAQGFDRAITAAVRLGLADAVRGAAPRRTWRQLEELGLPVNLPAEIVDALRSAYMGARTVAPKVL